MVVKMFECEAVQVVIERNAVDTNFFQICFANEMFEKFVIFLFLAYPRSNFFGTFFAESILKLVKFNSTVKNTTVTISMVKIKV